MVTWEPRQRPRDKRPRPKTASVGGLPATAAEGSTSPISTAAGLRLLTGSAPTGDARQQPTRSTCCGATYDQAAQGVDYRNLILIPARGIAVPHVRGRPPMAAVQPGCGGSDGRHMHAPKSGLGECWGVR